MLLQLKPLFAGEKEQLPIDCQLDLSQLEWSGHCPFSQPINVTGMVTSSAEVVTLRMTVSYRYDGVCDRCMTPLSREMTLKAEHILVTSLNGEDDSEWVLVEDDQLLLDELVAADILLNLPSKILCKEDCRGLCPQCGHNQNDGLCGCESQTVDPRLEVLKQLIK